MLRAGEQKGQAQGKLYKLGKGFRGRTWNKRFFVVSGQTLAYYSNEEQQERQERPHKVVDLTGCRVEDTGMERWSGKARAKERVARPRAASAQHTQALLTLFGAPSCAAHPAPCAQELYTLALHHNAFGSGERDVLSMGSRSPEEAAQWHAALLKARDRALERAEASAPAPAAAAPASPPTPPTMEAEAAPAAGETLSPSDSNTTDADAGQDVTPRTSAGLAPAVSTGGKSRSGMGRSTIGHVPPELRDVQEIARRGPAPHVSAIMGAANTNSGSSNSNNNSSSNNNKAAYGEDALSDDDTAGAEGPSVVQPPEEGATWRLCALENGLRFFEDGTGTAGSGWAAAPCTKVAGRVRAPSDVIFKLVMDLGRSREEWDCTFSSGNVIEQLDGHTEVVHTLLRPMRLASAALPSRPRDLVMTRYWRREEDGTYMILFRSTEHALCPPRAGVVRAEVACGCYIITPLPPTGGVGAACSASGDSLVMYLLETSPRGWMLPFTGLPRAFQRTLLMNVAGIRDFFEQLSEKGAANFETGLPDPLRDLLEGSDEEEEDEEEAAAAELHRRSCAAAEAAAADEARLLRTSSELLRSAGAGAAKEGGSPAGAAAPAGTSPGRALSPVRRAGTAGPPAAPTAISPVRTSSCPPATFACLPQDGGASLPFGSWPPPKGQKGVNCWCIPATNRFVVRSASYLTNGVKCPAGASLMSLVATDWLVSEDRIDDICGRPAGAVKRVILPTCAPNTHVFCVNLQVPGAKPYSIIFYFAMHGPPARDSVLGRFWHGDDAYRAPRFKLIPAITEGAWVVQRSVGTKPLIVGNALKTTYYGGGDSRYLEVDVDIGSSSVANSVTRFVMAYLRTLVIDLAFLVEAKTEAELPERLLGTIRVAHLDPDLAQQAPPREQQPEV
jgi:hypothetical protein